ncbi:MULTISPECIES: nuclear transport factor 2 family protein [Microbacterium]|uniref:nuclear transport factor 2 family protein n=1 Tax=Microbacterium TaxID=33882 RepID=UPI00278AA0F0|nr:MULTISPECIES: nuclear transport factor 2 family protein [Microbacterium]MDQ1082785.1 ketosteroid isomerase-like protein [Microbacterium sp. SORGH_AS_0344]MDQ1168445.1 ketosteroid isomerase-like protein [Microbacterium proteolyticum]
MSPSVLVDRYLAALERSDLESVLVLFTPSATVHSPLYGTRSPAEFYPELFADTASSRLTLLSAMHDATGAPVISFWFRFDWVLADGSPAPFTVVDVAELAPDGRIQTLHIIYDTASVRGAWDAQAASAEEL